MVYHYMNIENRIALGGLIVAILGLIVAFYSAFNDSKDKSSDKGEMKNQVIHGNNANIIDQNQGTIIIGEPK